MAPRSFATTMDIKQGRSCRRLITLFVICICLHGDLFAQSASDTRPKRVLALHVVRRDSPVFDETFRSTLEQSLPGQLDYYSEFIDLNRVREAKYQSALSSYLRSRYVDDPIDLVIASGPSVVEFLNRDPTLFEDVPIVFTTQARCRRRTAVDRHCLARRLHEYAGGCPEGTAEHEAGLCGEWRCGLRQALRRPLRGAEPTVRRTSDIPRVGGPAAVGTTGARATFAGRLDHLLPECLRRWRGTYLHAARCARPDRGCGERTCLQLARRCAGPRHRRWLAAFVDRGREGDGTNRAPSVARREPRHNPSRHVRQLRVSIRLASASALGDQRGASAGGQHRPFSPAVVLPAVSFGTSSAVRSSSRRRRCSSAGF